MRTPITTRSCTKTNMDSKQALVLFICSAVGAEKGKNKNKGRGGLWSLQREREVNELCKMKLTSDSGRLRFLSLCFRDTYSLNRSDLNSVS